MASTTRPRYYARRPFTYAGLDLYRGQVFTLTGARNDEKLIRLEYIRELEPRAEVYRCAECGAEFIGMAERTGHGRTAHPARSRALTPEEEDRALEREEKLLAELAPLNLANTLASKEA